MERSHFWNSRVMVCFFFYSVDGSEGKGDAEERLFWKLFSDPINVVCQALG